MRILVTGSTGHLGEALVRLLRPGHDVVGLDVLASPFTTEVGSIADRSCVRRCMEGVDAVLHAATLHKPHLVTHSREQFRRTNVEGTRVLLEEAVTAGVGRFLFTSTTSVFGRALALRPGAPAVWVTEEVEPVPRNAYGETKLEAEAMCATFHREHGLPCIVLRTSRFFPEEDDRREIREAYEDGNVKANEYLYRRVDLEDAARAHLLALERAPELGLATYVISAPTPFTRKDLAELSTDAPAVLLRLFPEAYAEYARRGWRMFPGIDRVYVSARARAELCWRPRFDFLTVLRRIQAGKSPRSRLARVVGSKGYHPERFSDGPYPVG